MLTTEHLYPSLLSPLEAGQGIASMCRHRGLYTRQETMPMTYPLRALKGRHGTIFSCISVSNRRGTGSDNSLPSEAIRALRNGNRWGCDHESRDDAFVPDLSFQNSSRRRGVHQH